MRQLSLTLVGLFLASNLAFAQEDTTQESSMSQEALREIHEETEQLEQEMEQEAKQLELEAEKLNREMTKETRQTLKEMRKDLKEIRKELRDERKSMRKEQERPSNLSDTSDPKADTTAKPMDIKFDNDGFSFSFSPNEEEKNEMDKVQFSWLLFDLGMNTYLSSNGFDQPKGYDFLQPRYGKSINFQLYIMKMGASIIDHNLSLFTGIGIDYNNYRFSDDIVLAPNTDTVGFRNIEEGYDKYKIVSQYVTIPLHIRYETKPEDHDNSFRIGLGGRAGYLIKSYSKLKENDGDKIKDFDNYNLNPFRYGLSARIGYGIFNLYANYYLSDMFDANQNPGLNPLSFGITLNGFEWDWARIETESKSLVVFSKK